jgi:hypothetical protein
MPSAGKIDNNSPTQTLSDLDKISIWRRLDYKRP